MPDLDRSGIGREGPARTGSRPYPKHPIVVALIVLSILATCLALTPRPSGAQSSTRGTATTATTVPKTDERGEASQSTTASADDAEDGSSLMLVDQTSWVAPKDTFRLVLDPGSDVPDDAELAIRVYPRVGGRIMFDRSIRGERLGNPLRPLLPATPLAALERDPQGRLVASLEISDEKAPEFGVLLSESGVYPVSVAITDEGGRELSHLITHLVRLPTSETPGPPLAVSVVVPVQAPPSHQPDGSISLDADTEASLDAVLENLTSNADVPVTIDPTPETIEALSAAGADTDPVSKLKGSSSGHQVMSSPYVKIDIGAWINRARQDLVDEQFAAGTSVLTERFGAPPEGSTAIVDETITPESLDFLHSRGIDKIVVPQDQLSELPSNAQKVTFTQSFAIETPSGTTMRAVTSDAELSSRLSATDDPVLNAHLALADLAVLYMDAPSLSRGVVLVLDRTSNIDGKMLGALLDGLRSPAGVVTAGTRPAIEAVTLDELFETTDAATSPGSGRDGPSVLVREYSSPDAARLGSLPERLDSGQRSIDSYRQLTLDDMKLVTPLENRLMIAGAMDLTSAQQDAYIDGVTSQINSVVESIHAPNDQVVTLTSRSGRIPLTIDNQLTYDVAVEVKLKSEKLDFPEGDTLVVQLAASSNTRIEVVVEARVSGSFPLDISVSSPDGEIPITSTRFTVRSTAISGLGLALSIGAGLFLAIWWVKHFRRVRRARRLLTSEDRAIKDITAV